MGHKSGGGNKSSSTQNTISTTTSFVQPMTQQLVQQAVAGVKLPPDLKYVGLNAQEQAALNTLTQGRNLAVQQGIQGTMSNLYQQNINQANSMQRQGDTAGANAQRALANVSPLLDQSKQMVSNSQQYLQQQANATNQMTSLFGSSRQALAKADSFIGQANAAAGNVQPNLIQAGQNLASSRQAAANAEPWLQRQGEAAQAAQPWLAQQGATTKLAETELNKGQALLDEVAKGQRNIADMSPEDRANYINAFYNSNLVNQQREVGRTEMNNNIASGIQGLNQQAIASGGMASSRAGVAQAGIMSKAMEAQQKNLLDFETNQYQLASQNATQSMTERLNALTGMGNTANSVLSGANSRLNAATQYGNIATNQLAQSQAFGQTAAGYNTQSQNYANIAGGFQNQGQAYNQLAGTYNSLAGSQQNQSNALLGLAQGYGQQASQYGSIAQGYNQNANTISGLAGQFGQLGSQYANMQGQYYNQQNALNSLANTQMNNAFTMNQTIQDQRIKDAANRFAAGQIVQQNQQAAANTAYQNQMLHLNPALTKLQTILPTLGTVASWGQTTVNRGVSSQQAAQASTGQQLGSLGGGLVGLGVSNALGGSAQTQAVSAGLGGYLGSSLFS